MMEFNPYQRQGQMDHLQSYFYTDSIFEHKPLLKDVLLSVGVFTNRNAVFENQIIK